MSESLGELMASFLVNKMQVEKLYDLLFLLNVKI